MTRVMTIVGTAPRSSASPASWRGSTTPSTTCSCTPGRTYDYELTEISSPSSPAAARPLPAVDTSTLGRVLGDADPQRGGAARGAPRRSARARRHQQQTSALMAKGMAASSSITWRPATAGRRERARGGDHRRLVDHVADFNLVYTEHARRNLLAEAYAALHPARPGSPMKEVLDHHREAFEASNGDERSRPRAARTLLVSAHREENVDDPARLGALLDCLVAARDAFDVPVLVSTHPRIRKRPTCSRAAPTRRRGPARADVPPSAGLHRPRAAAARRALRARTAARSKE